MQHRVGGVLSNVKWKGCGEWVLRVWVPTEALATGIEEEETEKKANTHQGCGKQISKAIEERDPGDRIGLREK